MNLPSSLSVRLWQMGCLNNSRYHSSVVDDAVCDVDGAGEFLDAWLLLMEKMTNPKNILDSPYVFGVRSSEPAVFSPLQYLVQIQKVCTRFCHTRITLTYYANNHAGISKFLANLEFLWHKSLG